MSTDPQLIRFGLLGAAKIAPMAMVAPAAAVPGVQLVAVAARDVDRARVFQETHGLTRICQTYEQLIDDPALDAIYIGLPISRHCEWAVRALEAGKHVLCEKSFSSNAAEAELMRDAAKASGKVLMDAFHYRYHPMFREALRLLGQGELGSVRHIDARFHVKGPVPETDIRRIYSMGGGVTMDIGCYPVSWVRHLMGEEPRVLAAKAVVDPADVDVALAADLQFASGATARISGRMDAASHFCAQVIVHAERGQLYMMNPLAPQIGHQYRVVREGEVETHTFDQTPTYQFQLEAFVSAIRGEETNLTGPDDAVNQMRLIDAIYQQAGLSLRGLDQGVDEGRHG